MNSTKSVLLHFNFGVAEEHPPPADRHTVHLLLHKNSYYHTVSCISPAIVMCHVTAQCVNSGCVAATSDGTCDCVKVILYLYDNITGL